MRTQKSVMMIVVLSFLFRLMDASAMEEGYFQPYMLTVEGSEIDYTVEDLNGDGLNDLLFFHMVNRDNMESRIFSVFYQTKAGFPAVADQSFKVYPDAIVYCTADVAKNPGKEILFFGKNRLFYYAAESGKFNPKPELLMETESMFRIPDGSFLEHYDFSTDLNGDGMDEILIPDFHQFVIHHPDATGAYTQTSLLHIDLLSRIISAKEASPYIVASYMIPNVLFADYNGDTKKDIIFVQENSLKVFFQNSTGAFSDEDSVRVELGDRLTKMYILRMQDRNIHQRDRYKDKTGIKAVEDLNHDGIMDVVTETFSDIKSAFNPTKTLKIYFGRTASGNPSKGAVFSKKPDYSIETTGFPGRGTMLDVNNDEKLDLLIPSIELGFFKIIRILLSGKADVDLHVYKATKEGKYNPEPDQIIGFTLHIDRKGRKLPVGKFEGDFNGDGKTDYMGDEGETIVIVFNPNSEILQSDPDVVFPVKIPQNGMKVKPALISDDPYSDIVMIYSAAIDEMEKNQNVCVLLNRNGSKKTN